LEVYQTTDIQGDVQKSVKVAVDTHGDLWVVDWFISLVLREAIEWALEPIVGPEGKEYFVMAGLVDEGHRASDVRRICLNTLEDFAALGRVGFFPVKGRSGVQVREVVGKSDQFIDGEEICTYHVAEDQFKWQLLKMITDREKRQKNREPVIHFPADADDDDDFVAEMCNERPVLKKSALGREKWEWEKLGPNDFWDCVKYVLPLWMIRRPVLVRAGLTR
jgi:hypothetical protein